MAIDPTIPRGTPRDYREFVRQMEASAERDSARRKALAWRHASLEKWSRTVCDLMDMAATLARQTGFCRQPLRYPRLHDVKWTPDHTS
ncbi:MAG: hypothetical protein R3C29_00850 [Dehalococcoidia bacterium]